MDSIIWTSEKKYSVHLTNFKIESKNKKNTPNKYQVNEEVKFGWVGEWLVPQLYIANTSSSSSKMIASHKKTLILLFSSLEWNTSSIYKNAARPPIQKEY